MFVAHDRLRRFWKLMTSKLPNLRIPRQWMPYHGLPDELQQQIDSIESKKGPPGLSAEDRNSWYLEHYEELYQVLVSAQETFGQRFHKGAPLYNIAFVHYLAGKMDEGLRYFLMSFVEDCITYTSYEIWNTFSVAHLKGLGISIDALAAIRNMVLTKIRSMSLPSMLLQECLDNKSVSEYISDRITIQALKEVDLDIQVSRLVAMLESEIRPCFDRPPIDENHLAIAVSALCRGIDPLHEREVAIVRKLGKDFTTDFLLFGRKVALELKLVKNSSDLSRAKDAIVADVVAYLEGVAQCVFLLYDTSGAVDDVPKLKNELERNKAVRLVVVKH